MISPVVKVSDGLILAMKAVSPRFISAATSWYKSSLNSCFKGRGPSKLNVAVANKPKCVYSAQTRAFDAATAQKCVKPVTHAHKKTNSRRVPLEPHIGESINYKHLNVHFTVSNCLCVLWTWLPGPSPTPLAVRRGGRGRSSPAPAAVPITARPRPTSGDNNDTVFVASCL